MPPPTEVIKYINEIQYNNIQYQDTKCVFANITVCIFLKRLNDGIKIYDILYKELNYKNETIIRQYFK